MARDHIVKMSLAYSFLIAMHIVITAIIFGLLIPYRGPQVNWPGVHRYLVFLGATTWITGFYYLICAHFFVVAYNCWAWLTCSVFNVLFWVAIWVDILVTSWQPMNDPNTWEYTVAGRLYAAAALAGLNAILVTICLIYFGKRLDNHRHSGAPYTLNGMWRVTHKNPGDTLREYVHKAPKAYDHRDSESPTTPTVPQHIYEMQTPSKEGRLPAYTKDV